MRGVWRQLDREARGELEHPMLANPRSLAFVSLLLIALGAPAPSPAEEGAPRLVLVLAVDQLRRDRVDAGLPGGLGRLTREGRVYTEAVLDHAMTETCPGHATMLTGRHPGPIGIPGNRFIDPETQKPRYCVQDSAPDAHVIGAPEGHGRSPRSMRATTLGDWLKRESPNSRVYSVSGKDRAAITMAGQKPDGAYWFLRKGRAGFTTSLYYRETLPDWVKEFNGENPPSDGFWAGLPETWTHMPDASGADLRPDDFEGESERYSRTSGHPVRDADLNTFAQNIYGTPFVDETTLAFARELVEREELGQRGATDVLAVSLSGNDVVGHLYGPYSHEADDALRRIDAALGEFLAHLEARVGAGNLLVVLTADHGVLPLPEWLALNEKNECPREPGRLGIKRVGAGLMWDLHRRFTWVLTKPKSWVQFAGGMIAVDRKVAAEQGADVGELISAVERYLESYPEIVRAWRPEEIAEGSDEFARLYRNSRNTERSGDLILQAEKTCLIWPFDTGTSHGSPYAYDRAVPIVFWGRGISPARVDDPARTIDIGPTLGKRLGIKLPDDLDGRPLF